MPNSEGVKQFFELKLKDVLTPIDDVRSLKLEGLSGVKLYRKYLFCEDCWNDLPAFCQTDEDFQFFQLNEHQNLITNENELTIFTAIMEKYIRRLGPYAPPDEILNTVLYLPMKADDSRANMQYIDFDVLDKCLILLDRLGF